MANKMNTDRPTFSYGTAVLAIAGALALAGLAFLVARNAEKPATPPAKLESTTTNAEAGFDILLGPWIRPDGGYVVTISAVDADGNLEAAYANPTPLPFQTAKASLDGETIHLFLELTAGGYNGSTYTLTYDPQQDVLYGVFYQAVAKQKFEVYFRRQK